MMHSCPGIFRASFVVLAAVALQGCLVVPNPKRIKGAEDVARITIGETRRDEVIALLGSPTIASDPSLLVYNWEKSRYFWVLAGGYSAAGAPGGHKGFRALVELDSTGRVVRVLSQSSVDAPVQPVETWERIRGCGRIALPSAVAVSPDAKQTVALVRDELCFVSMEEPGTVRRVALDKAGRKGGTCGGSLAFSPDGSLLAISVGGRPLTLWDVAADREVARFGSPQPASKWLVHSLHPVSFSPDGLRIAATDEQLELVVREIETGSEIFRHRPSGGVVSVAFSKDGAFLALGLGNGGLEILDAGTGQALMVRHGISESSTHVSAAFSPGGEWLAVSTPFHVELWDLDALRDSDWVDGRRAAFLLPFYRHAPGVEMYNRPVTAFSGDGTRLAVFEHETVSVIDVESLSMRKVYHLKQPVLSVAFDPAWRRLALLSANGLRTWDIPVASPPPAGDGSTIGG